MTDFTETGKQPKPLILASTSRYRAELLRRLQRPFTTQAPQVDESAQQNETAAMTAIRLAIAKAQAVAKTNPDAIVIGSDQVAELNGTHLNKPGNRDSAIQQLSFMSGQSVHFLTALCVVVNGQERHQLVPTIVHLRKFSRSQIEAYVDAEPSFDCAGAMKLEGLGISLVDYMYSDDPTAVIGLPLIALSKMLAEIDP
jgi:septum formation protein